MDDDQYIDDNDIRHSSLNLSDFHSADPPPAKKQRKDLNPMQMTFLNKQKQHADEEPVTVL